MDISFLHVNLSYKTVTSTQFSELLLGLQFLKNNQCRIVKYVKEHILEFNSFKPDSNSVSHMRKPMYREVMIE